MTKEELLKAEEIHNCPLLFDCVYIIPTKRTHESGYRMLEIIGRIFRGNEDGSDRYIKLSNISDVVDTFGKCISMDVEPENNCIRLFSIYGKLKPLCQSSSCEFEVVKGV